MIRLLRVILRALCTEQGSLKPLQTKYTSLYTVKIADNSLVSLLSSPHSPSGSLSVNGEGVAGLSCLSSLSCLATRPLSKAPFVMLAARLAGQG